VHRSLTTWKHITAEDLEALKALYDEYEAQYEEALAVPTRANIALRRETQTKLTAAIRQFVNQFLRYSPAVTVSDRITLGIPVRDNIRTPHTVLTEKVDFVLRVNNIREVSIDFWVQGATNKAKPAGYDGAVVIHHVSETPPTSDKEFSDHVMASRTPFVLHFDEAERGKRVYVALAWQNERGIRGEWSEYNWAIIP
jgi:hypothetical protein